MRDRGAPRSGERIAELARAAELAVRAEALIERGDARGALALAGDAYAIVECLRGAAARPARARILGALGNAHRTLGDYRRAGPLLRRALAVAQRDGEGRAAAIARNNLGILYKYSGAFDRARVHYRAALRIARRVSGADHVDIAGIYHNLGGLAFTQGRYRSAERWGRAALDLRTRLSGAGSLAVAADAAALAASLDGLGRHAEAQRLYARALSIFRRRLGDHHYEIAINLNNLGASLYAQGKLAQAARNYRAALELKKALLGATHVDVAVTANNLGLLYRKQGQFQLALRYVGEARAIFADQLGPRHPKTKAVVANWLTLRGERTG